MQEHSSTKHTKGTKSSALSFVYFVSFVFSFLPCGNAVGSRIGPSRCRSGCQPDLRGVTGPAPNSPSPSYNHHGQGWLP